jgi:hypothetical protein
MYAVAVARTDMIVAVGIDLEIEDSLDPRVWPYVLTQSELKSEYWRCPLEFVERKRNIFGGLRKLRLRL